MDNSPEIQFDEIGAWSEIKLEILDQYTKEYAKILSRQRLRTVYIDAFAGCGRHISERTGESVDGSPTVSLKYPFDEYCFVECDCAKVGYLRQACAGNPRVRIWQGDCNTILPDEVFPRVRYEDFMRGLCLLDPYGLHLNWRLIATAGKMQTIDLFLNFPVMDMNRNVFWHDRQRVDIADKKRMTCFWGDDSWEHVAYEEEETLFGPHERKAPNEVIAAAFQKRLHDVAGFQEVPAPVPMRNSSGGIVYYLFFASQKKVAARIASYILGKYANMHKRR